jgi:hypothetical protein
VQVLVGALAAIGLVAVGFVYLMMAAFACDSGWEGCADIASTSIFVYAGGGLVALGGGLVLGLVPGRPTGWTLARQIVAMVVMLGSPFVGFAAGIAYLQIGFSLSQG